jgi:hypothetical protein
VVLRQDAGGFREAQAKAEQKSGTVSDGAEQHKKIGTSARRLDTYLGMYQDSTLDRIGTACRASRRVSGVGTVPL